MTDAAGSTALVAAVHGAKRFLGGKVGGAFIINEYGQVLVPGVAGDGRVALVGECSGQLRFQYPFEVGAVFDLTDGRALNLGDGWSRPYLGVPHQLSKRSEIYFWNEDDTGGWKMTPPRNNESLVDALRHLRPYGAVRFIVTCGGLVLTKVQVGGWRQSTWEPRFVARLDFSTWFPKEN
jgi:hypothetical protein